MSGAVSPTPRLTVTPTTLAEANAYVAEHHRHHKPTVGHIFSVAVAKHETRSCMRCVHRSRCADCEGETVSEVCGVAIVGRPVARALQDGYTAEVNRVATDGTPNACSMLYATCWRAARALGYRRLVTYTFASEPGTSLRAAGWRVVGETQGRSWDTPTSGRPRVDWHPTLTTGVDRIRWEAM